MTFESAAGRLPSHLREWMNVLSRRMLAKWMDVILGFAACGELGASIDFSHVSIGREGFHEGIWNR